MMPLVNLQGQAGTEFHPRREECMVLSVGVSLPALNLVVKFTTDKGKIKKKQHDCIQVYTGDKHNGGKIHKGS